MGWERDFEENYKGKLSPDRPTVAVLVNGLFERTADLTSFEDAFCYLLEEPEALQSFYARLADWYVELLGILRRVYGVDMITFHDDMGTQRSPFFSTEIFRELLLPHYKKINDAAHRLGMYMNFHSCGCIEQHLEAIIEAGFDFWEGQDNSNDKKRTMERYGDRLAQASNIVPVGMSEEEMVSEIRRLIHELGPKGRFLIWLNTTQEPLFSAGSDGTDGPTDAAGGDADGDTEGKLRELGITVDAVLAANDAYHALLKTGGLLVTGPTGTNVNDLTVGLLRKTGQ